MPEHVPSDPPCMQTAQMLRDRAKELRQQATVLDIGMSRLAGQAKLSAQRQRFALITQASYLEQAACKKEAVEV